MLAACKDSPEEPVLHAASFMGSTNAVRVLLEHGANPNVTNKVNNMYGAGRRQQLEVGGANLVLDFPVVQ